MTVYQHAGQLPITPNTNQVDTDGDGVGDAATCSSRRRQLIVKDKDGDASKRKVIAKVRSSSPWLGGFSDPTTAGAELRIANPISGRMIRSSRPGTGLVSAVPGTRGYKYKDSRQTDRARRCCSNRARSSKPVLGTQIGYSLDEVEQRSVAAKLVIGTASDAAPLAFVQQRDQAWSLPIRRRDGGGVGVG
jgi:hypothetical protein